MRRAIRAIVVPWVLLAAPFPVQAEPAFVGPERPITTEVRTYVEEFVPESVHAVAVGGGLSLVVWEERLRDRGPRLVAGRIDETGALLDMAPIPLGDGSAASAAWTGTTFVVAWPSLDPSRPASAVRIAPDGRLLDDPPIALRPASELVIASDGWGVLALSSSVDGLWAQRIQFGADGPHPAVRVAECCASSIDLASNGSEYLASWVSELGVGTGVYGASAGVTAGGLFAAILEPDGTLRDPGGVVVEPEAVGAVRTPDLPRVCTPYNPFLHCVDLPSARLAEGVAAFPAHVASDHRDFLMVWAGRVAVVDPEAGVAQRRESALQCWPFDVASAGTGYIVACRSPWSFVPVSADGAPLEPRPAGPMTGTWRAVLGGGDRYLAAWTDDRSDVHATRLGIDGTVLDPAGIVVAHRIESRPYAQNRTQSTLAWGGNGFFSVWADDRAADLPPYREDIYARLLDADGGFADDRELVLGPYVSSSERELSAAWARGVYLVVWQTDNAGAIAGRRISDTGVLLDDEPFVLADAGCGCTGPQVASDGERFVVAMNEDGGYVRTVTVEPAGAVGAPTEIWAPVGSSKEVALAWGPGVYLLGVAGYDPTSSWAFVLGPDGAPRVTVESPPVEPTTVASDGNGFLIAGRGTDYALRAARVDADGTVLDPAGDRIAAGFNGRPKAAWDGTNYIVAFHPVSEVLRVARLTNAGEVLDPDGVPVVDYEPGGVVLGAAVTAPGRGAALAYGRYDRETSSQAGFLRMIREDG
jgi:hypothetical protein